MRKLLSVVANNKEVYCVLEIPKEEEKFNPFIDFSNIPYNKVYAVFDAEDNLVHVYTLDVNAYIDAIERGYEGNNGKCEAYYLEEQETLLFEDYRLRLRIKGISKI